MIKFALLVMSIVCCEAASAQSIPAIHSQSFAGDQVNLPSDLKGKIGIFIIGFSKKSSEQTKGWGENVMRNYGTDSRVVYYQMPVLADVPSLIRRVVVQGIRRQQPQEERTHFVPILENAPGWKQAVGFSAPDDAYVVVVDSAGQIKWSFHGTANADAYLRLNNCIAEMRSASLLAGPVLPDVAQQRRGCAAS